MDTLRLNLLLFFHYFIVVILDIVLNFCLEEQFSVICIKSVLYIENRIIIFMSKMIIIKLLDNFYFLGYNP